MEERPIPLRGLFTVLYTTGERLLNTQDFNELRLPSSRERDLLWRVLRDRDG